MKNVIYSKKLSSIKITQNKFLILKFNLDENYKFIFLEKLFNHLNYFIKFEVK